VGLLAASLLLFSAGTFAQSRAVEARNYEFGLASSDSNTSGSTSSGTLGVHGTGTLPIGSLLGVALSGYYSESNVRTGDVLDLSNSATSGNRPSCGFDSLGGDITLFARRPSLGKIAVSYGVGRLSPQCGDDAVFIADGKDKLSTKNYEVEAEVYLGDFTLGASRTSTDLDQGSKLESNAIVASWYPFNSFKVSVSGNDLYGENTYGLMLEHQPEFMGDAFGIHLGYSKSEQTPQVRTIYLGLAYYFGARVELKTRDRQYR
jgi:hypothetical protein